MIVDWSMLIIIALVIYRITKTITDSKVFSWLPVTCFECCSFWVAGVVVFVTLVMTESYTSFALVCGFTWISTWAIAEFFYVVFNRLNLEIQDEEL